VTVIELGRQIAGGEDRDVAQALLENFTSEGIEVLLERRVREVEGSPVRRSEFVLKTATENKRSREPICWSLSDGRRTPRGWGWKRQESNWTRGYIKVNERLETTATGVWAMGDCAGSPQFTHVAFDDFRVVRDNLSGGSRTTRDRLIPFCMFTDPELAKACCKTPFLRWRVLRVLGPCWGEHRLPLLWATGLVGNPGVNQATTDLARWSSAVQP